MSYKYFSNIHRCSCPKKFQGEHCEIGMGILTLTGEEGAPEIWGQGEMGGVQEQARVRSWMWSGGHLHPCVRHTVKHKHILFHESLAAQMWDGDGRRPFLVFSARPEIM